MTAHTHHNTEPDFVDTFGCSLTGEHREANGDQFVVAELKRAARVQHASKPQLNDSRRFGDNQAHVLLVADGLSGQRGASRASSLVVDQVLDSILNAVPWTAELDLNAEADLRQELKNTVVRSNAEVATAAQQPATPSEMASTLTMAFMRWPTAFVVHAGDSRAYLIRDGDIDQLTTDHTHAQQLIDEEAVAREEAQRARFPHVLWNAVGGDEQVTPELVTRELQVGDCLLICSAGLNQRLSAGAIRHLVESEDTVRAACERLVQSARSIGVRDDVTVAMARFTGETCGKAAADPPRRRHGSASAAVARQPAIRRGVTPLPPTETSIAG